MFYFCDKCRKLLKTVEDIHFVEDNSDHGFCSEECILEFYSPYVHQFANEEEQLRQELDLDSEIEHSEFMKKEHNLSVLLSDPDEVWVHEDGLESLYYTHIKNVEINGAALYFVAICKYVEDSPSFIIYRFLTEYEGLVDRYRRSDPLAVYNQNIEEAQEDHDEQILKDFQIPPEFITSLEFKKSTMLASHMEFRKDTDISYEDFHDYESYFEKTLDEPDEIYEFEDEEGDHLNTFIRSFRIDEISFFYVIIATGIEKEDSADVAFIPIISFPSVDNSLYTRYAVGKRVDDSIKN